MDAAAERGELSEWTAEERGAFRRALAERRERLYRATRLCALLLLLAVGAGVVFRLPQAWWMPLVGAVALLAVVLRLSTWKCPGCGERLPSRRSASVCPGCGAPLD